MTGLVEQDPYLRIKKLFDGKKFDEIITYCQKLLVKDPENKIALQNISTAYNMIGGYQDAIKSANKILEITFSTSTIFSASFITFPLSSAVIAIPNI